MCLSTINNRVMITNLRSLCSVSLHSFIVLDPCSILMGFHPKKLRIIVGVLKDKASLVKTSLSTRRYASSVHRQIIRATTHDPSAPPSDHRVAAVLSLGLGSRAKACACIDGIMGRLHGTGNAYVALKCLFLVHNIIAMGSVILKDQLSSYPLFGGNKSLNLSKFRDDSDPETFELSSWIRWYAAVLEQNLTISRVLGHYLSSGSSSSKNDKEKDKMVVASVTSDLLSEVNELVSFVEQICDPPESLHLQRKSLVYEVVSLVREDYGMALRELFLRVRELQERTASLIYGELTQLLSPLSRLEDFREKAHLLFCNRKRNDGFWGSVRETKAKVVATMKKQRYGESMVIMIGSEAAELTPFGHQLAESSRLVQLSSGSVWLGLDRVPLAVSMVG